MTNAVTTLDVHNTNAPEIDFGAVPIDRLTTRFRYRGAKLPVAIVVGTENSGLKAYPLRYDEKTGIHTADLPIRVGTHYSLKVGEKFISDPAARYLPEGVNGPATVVDPSFEWNASTFPRASQPTIFEMHIGTFGNTFLGCIEKLPYVAKLGVDAIQVMPIQQCVGKVNWGYDPTHSYATHNTYGTPRDFQRFVDECHKLKLKVYVDVVYNHRAPEGDDLPNLISELESDITTPWGRALNYENAAVREYMIQNACYWVKVFNVDGIRLDAAHELHDKEKQGCHVIREMSDRIRLTKEDVLLIAEFEHDDPRAWGRENPDSLGIDHKYDDRMGVALRAKLGGRFKNAHYYEKYVGWNTKQLAEHLSQTRSESYNTWEHHDWRGNEYPFKSIDQLIPLSSSRTGVSIAAFLKGSFTIFQGQEYGGGTFNYFRNFLTSTMEKAVEDGRYKEFEKQIKDSKADWPKPADLKTYDESRHHVSLSLKGRGERQIKFYKSLIKLRKHPAFSDTHDLSVNSVDDELILMDRTAKDGSNANRLILLANTSRKQKFFDLTQLGGDFQSWDVLHSTAVDRIKDPPVKVDGSRIIFRGIGAIALGLK